MDGKMLTATIRFVDQSGYAGEHPLEVRGGPAAARRRGAGDRLGDD